MNRKSVGIVLLLLCAVSASLFAQTGAEANAVIGTAKYVAAAFAVGFACNPVKRVQSFAAVGCRYGCDERKRRIIR